jgi:hypothetical protein
MLIAVFLVCVGLGLTRGTFFLVFTYEITPFESLDAVLALVGIVAGGAIIGVAVGGFVGAPKTVAAIAACVWLLLIASFNPLVCEILRMDRAGWLSPEATQTRKFVYYLAYRGQCLAANGKSAPKEGLDQFLQQLRVDGLLDARDTSYRGVEDGRDGWGEKLIVEVQDKVLRVRSKGRDGIDQRGSGDDIEAFVDLQDFSAMVRVTPELPERQKLFDW